MSSGTAVWSCLCPEPSLAPLDCQGKGWLIRTASRALVVWAVLPLSCPWILSKGPLCAALSHHGSLSLSPLL